MDITNKAVKVSRRMVEIEDALACGDLMAPEADQLRMEYEELSEWDELLNAYFGCRNKWDKINEQLKSLRAATKPIVDNYFDWLERNQIDVEDCDQLDQELYAQMITLNQALTQQGTKP